MPGIGGGLEKPAGNFVEQPPCCTAAAMNAYFTPAKAAQVRNMRIMDAAHPGAIDEAAEILRAGGLVAFPTETVYGLGADACNPLAVARIFEVKRRPEFDPIIVHVAHPAAAAEYGDVAGELARQLVERFWPGPLTLVVRKTERVPSIVTAGLNTVAIRMPAHPAALALIRTAGRAVAAPSANLFGYVSPTEAAHVAEQLGREVDLILDGGRCAVGIESTVLSLAGPAPQILRAGGVTKEEIEQVIGRVEFGTAAPAAPESPGQLKRHYATRTPLSIEEEEAVRADHRPGEKVGLLAFAAPPDPTKYAAVEVLSGSGNLREAAANLFAALRRLDSLGLDRLVARPVPARGLGLAIMDRLRRCAAGSCQEDQRDQDGRYVAGL